MEIFYCLAINFLILLSTILGARLYFSIDIMNMYKKYNEKLIEGDTKNKEEIEKIRLEVNDSLRLYNELNRRYNQLSNRYDIVERGLMEYQLRLMTKGGRNEYKGDANKSLG